MVSKKSLKDFPKNVNQYIRDVRFNNIFNKSYYLAKDTIEFDICLATLPSVVPMPKSIVDKIKSKHNYFRKSL